MLSVFCDYHNIDDSYNFENISFAHSALQSCFVARGIEHLLVVAVWFPTIDFGLKQGSGITKNSIIAPALNDRGDGIVHV